jgi:hypothetical protein
MSSKTVAAVEKSSFVKTKHELSDLLKRVQKGSVEAVDLIVTTMNAGDEKVPLKTRLECARLLLDIEIKVSAEISRDQLTRQIAEIKSKNLSLPNSNGSTPGGRQPPRLDFTTVHHVSGVPNE